MSAEVIKSIGKLIYSDDDHLPERDAIHACIVQVVAHGDLKPGQHVAVDTNTDGYLTTMAEGPKIGVVDPFLRQKVQKNDVFWLFVYPGSITSMSHVWEHPQLGCSVEEMDLSEIEQLKTRLKSEIKGSEEHEEAVREARAAIEKLLPTLQISSVDEALHHGTAYEKFGNGIQDWGDKELSEENWERFWTAYETITGNKVAVKTQSFFVCCS